LVIASLDKHSCEVIQPAGLGQRPNGEVFNLARQLPRHQTAVVILENYNEPQLGSEFRDRSESFFLALRGAGFQHIYFLQGKGVNDPDGLITLAQYD